MCGRVCVCAGTQICACGVHMHECPYNACMPGIAHMLYMYVHEIYACEYELRADIVEWLPCARRLSRNPSATRLMALPIDKTLPSCTMDAALGKGRLMCRVGSATRMRSGIVSHRRCGGSAAMAALPHMYHCGSAVAD